MMGQNTRARPGTRQAASKRARPLAVLRKQELSLGLGAHKHSHLHRMPCMLLKGRGGWWQAWLTLEETLMAISPLAQNASKRGSPAQQRAQADLRVHQYAKRCSLVRGRSKN